MKSRTLLCVMCVLACAIALLPITPCAQDKKEEVRPENKVHTVARSQAVQKDDINITADVVYGHKGESALTFDVFQPKNANGAAVLFLNALGFESGRILFLKKDGNAKVTYLSKNEMMIVSTDFVDPGLGQYSFDELLGKGFTVFNVKYGSSPGILLDEIIDDYKAAITFIRKHANSYHVQPDRLGLFGGSASGYLATILAASNLGIKSTVVYFPAGYDLVRTKKAFPQVYDTVPALHIAEDKLDPLSLKNHVKNIKGPVLIIYGDADYPFITETCQSLTNDLIKLHNGSQTITVPGIGHEFKTNGQYNAQEGDAARLKMVEWFSKHLGSTKRGRYHK